MPGAAQSLKIVLNIFLLFSFTSSLDICGQIEPMNYRGKCARVMLIRLIMV